MYHNIIFNMNCVTFSENRMLYSGIPRGSWWFKSMISYHAIIIWHEVVVYKGGFWSLWFSLSFKMAESETGLTDLMDEMDLGDVYDTGYERDVDVCCEIFWKSSSCSNALGIPVFFPRVGIFLVKKSFHPPSGLGSCMKVNNHTELM